MQTSTIEATWRGIDGRAQEGWYDVRLTHRLVDAAGETILPAGRIAAGRLSEREDEPSLNLAVPSAGVDDTDEWLIVVYISFEERRTSETYVLEPVAAGEVIDLALRVPVADVSDGFASGTVVRGIDGDDGRSIESVDLDDDALVFTYSDGTLEFVSVEGGFGGVGDAEPGRGIESLTQVDEVTLLVTFTDETSQTLTLPRGEDGDDAAPLTITGDRLADDGDVVLSFSDGTAVVIPGGRDADALTVTGSTATADGVRVAFSDGSEVVVPRGEDGDDGATPHVGPGGNWWVGDTNTGVRARGPAGESFTYADFTPEQLEALRGPRGYGGRGIESITDEDGDGVATVTYSDGETADLPLPVGGGGGGGFDIDEAGSVTLEHLTPLFREFMLQFGRHEGLPDEWVENSVYNLLVDIDDMSYDHSPTFASFMFPALLSSYMSAVKELGSAAPTRGRLRPGDVVGFEALGWPWMPEEDREYVKVTLTNLSDTDHEVRVHFGGGTTYNITAPAGGEASEIYQAYGGTVSLEKTHDNPGYVLYHVEVFS